MVTVRTLISYHSASLVNRGYVADAGIVPFTAESLDKMVDKNKVKNDTEYRLAVQEAILLIRQQGVNIDGFDVDKYLEGNKVK
jgi:hypothetical protein